MFNFIATRYVLAIMCFLGLAVLFLINVSLSVAIVAMVKIENNTAESRDFTKVVSLSVRSEESDTCPGGEIVSESGSENGEFAWDEELQGYVLSSYYYGYMATQLLGGRLSEIFGTKLVFGSGVFLSGLVTALSPVFARLDVSGLIAARVVVGLLSGVVIPSMHHLLSKWFVPAEMLFFGAFMMSGNPAGAMVSMAVSGVLAEAGGWTTIFYVFGGVGMLFIVPWAFLIYNSPTKHPRISESEKQYIIEGTGQNKEENEDKLLKMTEQQKSEKKQLSGEIMFFLGLVVVFLMNVSFSVAIVAMVKVANETTESQGLTGALNMTVRSEDSDTCPGDEIVSESGSENGEFEWDEELQGYILSSYYYGSIASQLLGGRLSEIFGTKLVFGSGVFLSGLVTVLSPVLARLDVSGLIAARVLIGILSGVAMPSVHHLMPKWFIPAEITLFGSFMMSGSPAGAMISVAVSGVLADVGGWTMVFYVFGGVGMLFIVPWAFLVYDTPSEHPRISESEKQYIIEHTGQNKEETETKISHPVPWVAIFTSGPMYVHMIMGIGGGWVNFTIMTELPSYLSNVLHFDVQASGTSSALPYVFLVITSLMGGFVSQKLIQSGRLSRINVYRIFNALSGYGSALGLLLVTFVGCDNTANVALMVISMAFCGAYLGGSMFNHLDLGSNFSGTLAGMFLTVYTAVGVLTPTVVGLIVSDQKSISSWKTAFYVGAAIPAGCTTFYLLFGSADEQSWNKVPEQSLQAVKEEGKVHSNLNATKMPEQQNSEKNNLSKEGGMFNIIPTRYILAIMCFLGLAVLFLINVSLSVAIVAMVKTENKTTESQGFTGVLSMTVRSENSDTCPGGEIISESGSENGEFEWDEELQGFILSSYFYGSVATQLLGGRLSEIFGTKLVFGSGVFLSGFVTALTPVLARLHVSGLIAARVVAGLCSVSNPAGAMISMAVSGVITKAGGWVMVFYVFGGIAMFFVVPWAYLIYNTPTKHPRITESEKQYIIEGTGQNKEQIEEKVSHPVPWVAILTSGPMYVHMIMGIGGAWVNFTIMTELPSYLSNVLHFDVESVSSLNIINLQSGISSALPYVSLVITSLISGFVSQKLLQSGRISRINGLAGAYQGGSIFNHLDLGSNFSGTVAGMFHTTLIGTGVVTPTVVGLIITDQRSISSWKTVFYVGAAIPAVCTTVYMFFGTADEQSWNKVPDQSSQVHEEREKESCKEN
ncbi:hypothetical protein C0J52_09548 [Blattella germanica]|nr:hypothetical protein C0J52_09548 [Blattella germanica]